MNRLMRITSFAFAMTFTAALASEALAGGVSPANLGGRQPLGQGANGWSTSTDAGRGNDDYSNPEGRGRGGGFVDHSYGDPGNSGGNNQGDGKG